MSKADKFDLLGKLLPEFTDGINKLWLTQLKYNVLTSRLSTN